MNDGNLLHRTRLERVGDVAYKVGSGLVLLMGLALAHEIYHHRKEDVAEQPKRRANLDFVQKYSDEHFEHNTDFYHYSFSSRQCPVSLGGLHRNDRPLHLLFPSSCPEEIALEGLVISHNPECGPAHLYDTKTKGRTEGIRDLVVKTASFNESIPTTYVQIPCRRE